MGEEISKTTRIIINILIFVGYLFFGKLFFWWPVVILFSLVFIPSVFFTLIIIFVITPLCVFFPFLYKTNAVTALRKFTKKYIGKDMVEMNENDKKVLRAYYLICSAILILFATIGAYVYFIVSNIEIQ